MFDVSISSADLVRELAAADKVVSRKATIPVLANVLMELEDGGVRVSATDLELAVTGRCQSAGLLSQGTAAVTLPAKRLYDLARSLPETNVKFSANGSAVTLTAGRFNAVMQTLPASDFPGIARPPDGKAQAVLGRAALRAAVQRVKFATDADDKRYYLNGAQLEVDKAATLVATDGHRLAMCVWKCTGQAAPAIIPRRTLDALAGLLEGDGPDVEYCNAENHLFFTAGDRMLLSRKIDGQFPAYQKIVPKPAPTLVQFSRGSMQAALRRLASLTDFSTRKVVFKIAQAGIDLQTNAADVGNAEEHIDASYAGPAVELALNLNYVLDFTDNAGVDMCTLSVTAPEAQTMWTAEADGVGYTYVVMPMRR